ncbi:MAG: hypothetical protein M0Q49_07210 [Porticoccaceae bacterium]|nr:hypothetical protein [Porticoccaceae bacterium]
MTKVLFLVSRPGLGHIRCAESIGAALARIQPQSDSHQKDAFETDMLDIHDLLDGRVSDAIIDGYLRMTREQPALYQRLYDLDHNLYRQLCGEIPADRAIADFLTDQQRQWFPEFATREWYSRPRVNFDQALLNTLVNGVRRSYTMPPNRYLMRGLLLLIYRVLARRLRDAVSERQADILVATQMYPNALLSPARKTGQLCQPLIGVITDYGVHGVWVRAATDYYCVPHTHTARQLHSKGVPWERILITGIPLMPHFAEPHDQCEVRTRLALPQRPTVLVTGGEYALGTQEAVRRLVQSAEGPMVLVTTSRHNSGSRELDDLARAWPQRLRVCSWSDHMPLLMSAADVVVGKAGGLTISESLACGRPFIATCSLGGQEGHNVHFLEQQGVGLRLDPEQLTAFLNNLFSAPAELHAWQARAATIGRRHAARAIAELVSRCAANPPRRGEGHAYPN